MPIWKCNKCHHEWEGTKTEDKCDWCNSLGHVIQAESGFERMLKENKYINNFFKKP